ncbi:MAG: TonB-dependent receptor [Acidobacteria bacterium]|nr:TonB-dependent receptor [Acidobacteriota bacterium]
MRLHWLLLVACSLAAQTPGGRISGKITDPSGAAIAGVRVEAQHLETGLARTAESNAAGEYSLLLLPVGPYRITASHRGFQTAERQVRLEVGRHLTASLELALEPQRTAVVVADSTSLTEPYNAALGTIISRETLQDLPLNGREFLQLALLGAGAHPAAPGSELSRQNNSGLHLNGARETSNNFLLDGVDNNDLFINRIVVSPPLDGVREFRLHGSGYQAEYGRSGGAQVNVLTQAGGNRFHGTLYEYLRNASLDARNFFDAPERRIPQFQRNQFGGAAGGPIRKERSFFFLGYEGTRLRQGITKIARVPTAAEKAGDFSASPQPVLDPFTQRPFPGNRIPAERLDPIGTALARYWPDPNRSDPVQNLVSAPVASSRVDQGFARVDHYFSPRDTTYARYNFSHDRSLAPFNEGVTNIPGFGSFAINRGQNLAISETHVSSAATIWEARLGFNRLRRSVLQQNAGNDIGGKLGIPGLSRNPVDFGFPAIVVPGYDSLADNTALPIIRADNTWHALGNLTHARGRHTFKTGGEYRRFAMDGLNDNFARGQFTFQPSLTGNALAGLLLGLPSLALRTKIDNPMALRAHAWNFYAQDDWRLSPRVTLNLGLRYEWNRPPVDSTDRFTVFDLAGRKLVPAGTGGLPRAGFTADWNNFAPRFGLSWSPGTDGKLVVHSGYGIFHDSTILEANSGLYFNPPYFELSLFFPSAQRLLTLRDPFPAGGGIQPAPSINSVQPDFRTSYVQQWNLAVEREVARRAVVRGAYVGSKGTKLLRRRDINQPAPGPGNVNARRPISGFANLTLVESGASSAYHSAQVSVERHFRPGIAFSAAYTFSKSLDDASEFLATTGDQSFPQNSNNLRAERGRSNFDLRHRLAFYSSWDLKAGWQWHAIGVFQSGPPYTPQLSFDNSNTGNTGGIFGADRPNVAGPAFATPPPLQFGNAGRNILTGSGLVSLDSALVKTIRLSEALRVDLRAEVFNLLNHPNFDLPRRFSDLPTFGRVTSAGPSRQIQFSLRLRY